ncbi:hypothetical protein GF420_07240, partial [candidate division GN15 bacterium]|nr:hypothetical protein [candidate division GN15 bacterium]
MKMWHGVMLLGMTLLLAFGYPVLSEQPLSGMDTDGRTDDGMEAVSSERAFCYKAAFPDYCPAGMPDFGQLQDFTQPPDGTVDQGYCGPVAVANCFWWFDSKFETNPQTPPMVSDNYPLVSSYGVWDDHDPA